VVIIVDQNIEDNHYANEQVRDFVLYANIEFVERTTNKAGTICQNQKKENKIVMKLKCPKCKCRVIVVTLACNPAKYECQCSHCDFGLKYSMRNNPNVPFTQNELDDNFEAVNLS